MLYAGPSARGSVPFLIQERQWTTYLQPKYPNFMVLGLNYGLIYEFLILVVPQFVFVILMASTHPD